MLKSWWRWLQFCWIGLLTVVLLQSCFGKEPTPSGHRSELVAATCRVVRHELGESCIPQQPQRVIVMDQESLEILVALGLRPIATTIPNRVGSKASILPATLTEIPTLGKEGTPNLEKIVQLQPDLIVGMYISSPVYDLLVQIAPTISVPYSQAGWQDTLRQVATLLGESAQAENLLTAYHQRVKQLQQQFNAKLGPVEVTLMRFYTDVHLTQFLNQNSFAGSVLADLQAVSIPEHQQRQRQIPNSDWGYVNISLERLELLEADAMLVALDPGAERSFRHYEKSPLWQNLEVVKQNRVYFVDSGHWVFGNILSAHAVLDDLCVHLMDAACPRSPAERSQRTP